MLLTFIADAHHSMALFDLKACRTLTGTVRTFQFQYPHSWLWLYIPNARGEQVVWGFEAAAPANMIEKDRRWSRATLKKGDQVTVRFSPLKKPDRPAGTLASVTLANGTVMDVPAPTCGGGPPNIPADKR
jgi:hypothetical protein